MNVETGSDAARALVLWDVDHTLIENDGVSKATYGLAVELLTGRPTTVPPVTDGRTDVAIMSQLLADNGDHLANYGIARLSEALTEAGLRNEAQLAARGHALPGAAACLARLTGEPGVIQSVLTGNVEANARVKLRAFGLDPWVDFSVGGYGVLPERAMLVPVAQRRAATRYGLDPNADVTVLVGDTPADVQAGRLGGARVIAVATGVFSVEQLRAAGADAVVADLVDVDAFVRELRRVTDLGPVRLRPQADDQAAFDHGGTNGDLAGWAREMAEAHLDVPGLQERRWLHVQAVAGAAERMAAALGLNPTRLVAAAWLHDIGYSPSLAVAGFHPLDAARFLESAGVDDDLVALVAHHSGAVFEAVERGLGAELTCYLDHVDAVRDALWACDMTTGPVGEPVTLNQRLKEIHRRYGPDHFVSRAITSATPELEAAVERTRHRLRQAGSDLDS